MEESRIKFIIIDELNKRYAGRMRKEKNNIRIPCPFHKGRSPFPLAVLIEPTPGHRLPIGSFKCWSCPAKGEWNKLADRIGAAKIEGTTDDSFGSGVHAGLEDRVEEPQHCTLPKTDIEPWIGDYRGLPEKFMQSLPSYRWYQMPPNATTITERILWPAYVNGNLLGYTGRDLSLESELRYLNSPGRWALKAMFPYDHPLNQNVKTIALMEGPYSAMRPLSCGIPSMCIFGIQNWSDYKRTLLVSKGIENIILCFDGDPEGQQASDKLASGVDTAGEDLDYEGLQTSFNLKVFLPPTGKDPGNMPDKYVRLLKKMVEQF